MSKFFTPTNSGRITKMVDTVGMLAKSAASNKATTEDINTMFEPLVAALQEMGVEVSYDLDDAQASAPQVEAPSDHLEEIMDRPNRLRTASDGTPREPGKNAHSMREYKPLWASVQEMAEQAPMDDLGQAVIVYAKRLEDALFTVQDRDPALTKENKTPLLDEPVEEDDDDDDAWD